MPSFNIVREVQPKKSFRVASVVGRYDLQSEKTTEHFKGELDLSREWQIGAIVGSSGTGKTTIARELFGEALKNFEYHAESILDDMPQEASIEAIERTFNSVGFSSPPSWMKPYSCLSTGEQMRVNLARALLEGGDLIVFDEFTSTVDRQVAKTSSLAVAKAIRRSNRCFIAVTCHFDILEWLEPDWIFNTNEMKWWWSRGSFRRPESRLEIFEDTEKDKWPLFRRYHYLSGTVARGAKCFVAYLEGYPVAFCAVSQLVGFRGRHRISRLVVLPDYQGIGIGGRFLDFVARLYSRINIMTSNPALISFFKKSTNWKLISFGRSAPQRIGGHSRKNDSSKRLTTSWEFVSSGDRLLNRPRGE